MTTHTPGPWDVKTREEWEGGYDFFSGPDGAFTFMADVEADDARLIASAPDLLAALQEISTVDEFGLLRLSGQQIREIAQSAIVKAGGLA